MIAVNVFREFGIQPLERTNRDILYEVIPTHHFYSEPLIRIRQVVFDQENSQTLIGLDGVHGEIYILRLSHSEVGLLLEEDMHVRDEETFVHLPMVLNAGHFYTLNLYDYYNTQHSTFTWRQPFEFVSHSIIVKDFIDVPAIPLAKTNDMFNSVWVLLLFLLVIVGLFISRIRRKGMV